jgi:hypothetical protein
VLDLEDLFPAELYDKDYLYLTRIVRHEDKLWAVYRWDAGDFGVTLMARAINEQEGLALSEALRNFYSPATAFKHYQQEVMALEAKRVEVRCTWMDNCAYLEQLLPEDLLSVFANENGGCAGLFEAVAFFSLTNKVVERQYHRDYLERLSCADMKEVEEKLVKVKETWRGLVDLQIDATGRSIIVRYSIPASP